MFSAPWRYGSGCRETADFPYPSPFQRACTGVKRRASRGDVVNKHDGRSIECPSCPRQRECISNVGVTAGGWKTGLHRCPPSAPEGFHNRQTQEPREIGGLVEPALAAT
jgi:hypothetical protein